MPPPPFNLSWIKLVFFDDILVYSPNATTHKMHLGAMFTIMKDNELFANRKNWVFGHSRIQYLGHWNSSKGVEADREKVKAMVNRPQSKDISELKGIHRLNWILSTFCETIWKDCSSSYESPIEELFCWNEEATVAFEALKRVMVSIPVLALPNFSVICHWNWCIGLWSGSSLVAEFETSCLFQSGTFTLNTDQVHLWDEINRCAVGGPKVETLPVRKEIEGQFKPKSFKVPHWTKGGSTSVPKMVGEAAWIWFWNFISTKSPKQGSRCSFST